jgi:hypothetical protein
VVEMVEKVKVPKDGVVVVVAVVVAAVVATVVAVAVVVKVESVKGASFVGEDKPPSHGHLTEDTVLNRSLKTKIDDMDKKEWERGGE